MINYYVVDAFTDQVFGGNPAGVCVLDREIDDGQMQKIAAENNLSETAFVHQSSEGYHLRWFTPKAEIDLCGHATLGTAFVILSFVEPQRDQVSFSTLSGTLTVTKKGDRFEMDFPSRPLKPIHITDTMVQSLGVRPLEAYLSRDYFFVLEDEETVRTLSPDFQSMNQLNDGLGVIVTSHSPDVDFVSRYFCPELGVPEDPVTGSSHCNLIPFWSQRLEKKEMTARQLSARGGTLYCTDHGERVTIGGKASLYLRGEIFL